MVVVVIRRLSSQILNPIVCVMFRRSPGAADAVLSPPQHKHITIAESGKFSDQTMLYRHVVPASLHSGMAIENHDLPMIKLLLQSGCARDHIYENGATALMTACEKQTDEVANTLLQAGASVNKSDSDAWRFPPIPF